MFAGIPNFHAELPRSAQHGDTTWSEWIWSGTRTDGLPFEVRGVTLFQIDAEFIVAGRLYMEEVEAAQVGIEQAVEELSGERPLNAPSADSR